MQVKEMVDLWICLYKGDEYMAKQTSRYYADKSKDKQSYTTKVILKKDKIYL